MLNHLAQHVPAWFRWAVAGRSREKLEALLPLCLNAAARPVIRLADSTDAASVDKLVASTRGMAPFALGQRFVAEMLSGSFNAMAKSINRDGALGQLGRTAMKQLMDWVGPKPGQGPSEKHLEESGYLLRMKATFASGAIVRGHATAHGHPGYRSTAMLIAEAGLLLAGAGAPGCSALPRRSGFLTPATAFAVGSVPAWARAQMLFEFTD